jgi:hypothetical protein
LTLTSNASGPLAVPAFVTTPAGEYAVNQAACGSSLAALGSCQIGVTFKPAATGAQTGTFAVNPNNLTGTNSLLYSGVSATLSGTGVDFTISLNPTAGSVAAGDGTTTIATLTPIAGFSAPLFVSCKVAAGATAAMCSLSSATLTPAATTVVSIGTTSQYTVIGYSGFGQRLAAVEEAQERTRFPPTSQNRDMGHPRAAAGAAGGDGAGADQLHGQAAGGKWGVDRAGELYGDGDGDRWATEPFGDVQLDGAVKQNTSTRKTLSCVRDSLRG